MNGGCKEMIRRDKFKLSMWVLAIISVVLLGNVAFAEEMIPRGVIKSDYVVGDKSGAEHVYYGEVWDFDDDTIETKMQDGFSMRKNELFISNKELIDYLSDLDTRRILEDDRYKFYLKDELHEGAELVAIEKVVGEKDCGIYYLSDKVEDEWIFGYGAEDYDEYDSDLNNAYENYFSLKLGDKFLEVYSDYDMDDLFEDLRNTPMYLFIDDEGNIDGILKYYNSAKKEDIYEYMRRLEEKPVVGSNSVIILNKKFSEFEISGNDAKVDFDDETDVEINLNDADMELDGDKEYIGRFLKEDENLTLLSAKEYVNQNSKEGKLKIITENCKRVVVVSSVDYENHEAEVIWGEESYPLDEEDYKVSFEYGENTYVLNADYMKEKALVDNCENVTQESVKIEPGQIIYTDNYYRRDTYGLSENTSVVLKKPETYIINSGENEIKKVFGEGFSEKYYLRIDEEFIDLEDLEKVMVLEDESWKVFDMKNVLNTYDLESEFECILVRDPIENNKIVSLLFKDIEKKKDYSKRAIGVVVDIEERNGFTELSLDISGDIKKLKCYKDKIDISNIELGDMILAYYNDEAMLSYENCDRDNIEEKVVFIEDEGYLKLLEFDYEDYDGKRKDFVVFDGKTFDDINENIKKGHRVAYVKILNDNILLDYKFIGDIDEEKIYRILDYDENSITFGFGASIDASDEEFTSEQREKIELSEVFKIEKGIEDVKNVNVLLDGDGKIAFIHCKRPDFSNYSSYSPSGKMKFSYKSVELAMIGINRMDESYVEGEISDYDSRRCVDFEQKFENLKMYKTDIFTDGKPLELDVKNMDELRANYSLEELDLVEDYLYTGSEHLAFFEENDGKITSIVYLNIVGDGVKGHISDDEQFVDENDRVYDIPYRFKYNDRTYSIQSLLKSYNKDIELRLLKMAGDNDYYAEVAKASVKRGDKQTAVVIVNYIDEEEKFCHFITADGEDLKVYANETDEKILQDLFDNFQEEDIVKIDYYGVLRNGVILESVERFCIPVDSDSTMYKVVNIDGLDITLETGDFEISDDEVEIKNLVSKVYKSVEGAVVFGEGKPVDLSREDFVTIHLNDAGKIDFVHVLGKYEILQMADKKDLVGDYLVVATPRLDSDLNWYNKWNELRIKSIASGEEQVIKNREYFNSEGYLGRIINNSSFDGYGQLDLYGIEDGMFEMGFVESRNAKEIVMSERGKFEISDENLIKVYYNGEEVNYSEIEDFDLDDKIPEMCRLTVYEGKVIFLEISQITDLGIVFHNTESDDSKVLKLNSGETYNLKIHEDEDYLFLDLEDLSDTGNSNFAGFIMDKGLLLYTKDGTRMVLNEKDYKYMKSLKPLFESSDSSFDEYGIKLGQEMDSLEYDDTKVKEMDKNRELEDGEFWIIECTSEANSENIKAVILENDESKIKTDIKLAGNYIVVRAKEQLEKDSDYYMTIVLEDGSVYKSNLGCVEE
jgi:hypothetical protein